MSEISKNIDNLRAELPVQVRLVAVSKNHPAESIREAYLAGQRIFGENRVQELLAKQPLLPGDIEWHLIGHLQGNKVKAIVPYVSMIHSIDSVRLLLEVSKEAVKIGKTIDCLLQVHIAREETKFGFDPDEVRSLLADTSLRQLPGICFRGLMGMATFTDDPVQVDSEFELIHNLFIEIKGTLYSELSGFNELSIGMSGDYHLAVKRGSTLVRIGTAIFGSR
jgi:pyridoxal phosphate enzyme (YggS family)